MSIFKNKQTAEYKEKERYRLRKARIWGYKFGKKYGIGSRIAKANAWADGHRRKTAGILFSVNTCIYLIGFVLCFSGADASSREKDIEDGLTTHITQFLLELGQGFSFVGRQVHLELAGHDYYIDMLFYHLRLRCFVVVELKAVPFDPGMMGQLSFYQSVVDDTLRHESDGKTIGLLLVKSKDETIVRYSLEGINKPIGIASWETAIEKDIADKWKSSLPTIEELEAELNKE